MPQALPPEVQNKLKEYPFTRPSAQDTLKTPLLDSVTRRQNIRTKLRSDMSLSNSDVDFLKGNPEDAKWLKDHIETRFWLKFESLATSRDGQT